MKAITLILIMSLVGLSGFAQKIGVITIGGKHFAVEIAKIDSQAFTELETLAPDTVYIEKIIHDTIQVVKHDTVTVIQYSDTTYTDTISPIKKEHEYVDLELPSGTLWATCNIGANKPEGYGDYFAWGETTPQSDNAYSWASYKWCKETFYQTTKYCIESAFGSIDGKAALDSTDDAAAINWGKEWCMPTQAQHQELINANYTTTTWTTLNGINGRLITSKKNGKSIFLPAAGEGNFGSLKDVSSSGYYWSSEINPDRSICAWSLEFSHNNISANYDDRYYGRSVRPVRK